MRHQFYSECSGCRCLVGLGRDDSGPPTPSSRHPSLGWRVEGGGLEGWRAGGLEGWRAGGLEAKPPPVQPSTPCFQFGGPVTTASKVCRVRFICLNAGV